VRPALLKSPILLTAFAAQFWCVQPMQADEGVSRELARERARIISNVRYRLDLTLKSRAARMPGHETIEFDLSNVSDPLVLDFRDLDDKGAVINGSAHDLRVNGRPAELTQSDGHILIPGARLRAGQNKIELDFDSPIAEANRAVTRYTDNQDGGEYIYTLFVPMDASLAFPCFDQPDLKARFELALTAPAEWAVISNTSPEADTAAGPVHTARFEETNPISTYLFAFAAGPFQMLATDPGAVPLKLFVRRSMLARAREEWPQVAETTRKGMDRMAAFFAQPFPFPKYDQVLIPGFAYGGMEHAGATFLNEDVVIFKSAPTINDRNRRSETVLHELAHQWFGDLVTMRWFDDLWLKEGFAQYMAFHTQAELEPPDPVWKRFYQTIKPAAYRIDGTHGTTPIYQQIPNLKDAKSAYGAIVYQKAPSLLRLLAFNLGEDQFREGIRIFLKEHTWANAEWNDLIGAFSRASGTDLKPWARAWVEQRGMPRVEIRWACDGKRQISSFEISQTDALAEGHVWPLRTQILLAYKGGRTERVMATLEGASAPVQDAVGKACPDYVFGNDEDHSYGRFLLDARSQAAIVEDVPRITNAFRRALLWGALWDSVRESRMAPLEYSELGLRALPSERDVELTVSILGRMRAAFTDYLSDSQRATIAGRFEDLLIRGIEEAPATDLRITYFRSLVSIATSKHAMDVLKDLLAGRMTIREVPLKQQDRWNVLTALLAHGDSSASELLAAETGRDKTEDGRKYAYVAGAGVGTRESKQKYFGDYLARTGVREDWVSASLPMFNYWSQTDLTLPYLKPALEALPQMKRERKIFFVLNWLADFVGGQISEGALKTVDEFLAAGRADPDLRLKILEVRDELERTVRIRARFSRQP
jgi:aminopeptidase N